MSVVKGNRRESKVEFDNSFYKVHDDAVQIIKNSFGADKEMRETNAAYIKAMSVKVLEDILDIGKHIRIANSIYPKFKEELKERRIHQDKAIGLCYDILTKYQLIMNVLKVKDDKYTVEIKDISHEINCLKSWRASDNKRFKELG